MEALLEFVLQQGPSKAGNLMEWDKLWTLNKQILDPVVPRYMAVAEGESNTSPFLEYAFCSFSHVLYNYARYLEF